MILNFFRKKAKEVSALKATGIRECTSPRSFKDLWASGAFDHCDYFALTAPLNEWSVDIPMRCVSEQAGGITEDGWGIVTCHLVVYLYSTQEGAERRAQQLGGNVKPLKLKCLSCFAGLFSKYYSYVDLILDEAWHMKAFACRDFRHGLDYGRVGHVRLDSPDGFFQLVGCADNNSLGWEPYRGYHDPKHPTEWCRPVPFPGYMVSYDHSAQGSPMDMEILHPPGSLQYFVFKENIWALDVLEGRRGETIFARPIGPLAFANLLGEPVRLTRGEGVWVPIARNIGQGWYMMPWSQNLEPEIISYLHDPSQAQILLPAEGAKSYTNQAIAMLEIAFLLDEEANDEGLGKERDEAAQLLAKATKVAPWDWYAHTLYRDVTTLDLKQIPAVLHADRICWHILGQDRAQMEAEFMKAMSFRKDYELALYNYQFSLRQIGCQEEAVQVLKGLIKVNLLHSQANFDLALLALQQNDEESEMKHYEISADSDPHFGPPLYNLGKTHEDRGDFELAKAYYERTLDLDPYYVEAIEQLGFIAYREGNNEEAAKYFLRALRADPRRKETYQHVAWFAEQSDNSELLNFAAGLFKHHMPRDSTN